MGQEADSTLLVLELKTTSTLEEKKKWNTVVYCRTNDLFLSLSKTKPMKMSHNDDELSNWRDNDLYVDIILLYME